MVNYPDSTICETIDTNLDIVISAISSPTRRDILLKLSAENLTVKELASHYFMSLPAVSKNLKILEQAGFLIRHKSGRESRFEVNLSPLKLIQEYLDSNKKFY